jgi:uncharacterized repeat protein (TIGR01451 family)
MVALLALLLTVAGSLTFPSAGGAAIPPNFFVVVDQDGANDVNSAQTDLTQMGRDDTDPNVFKLFWSWDATNQWTGSGSTGDACALFDTNGNGRIDFVVCGQIHNTSPTVVVQTDVSPFVFSCNDVRFDRCGQPEPITYTPAQIQAGVLTSGLPGPSPSGNLITDTDPFPNLNPDQNWPSDTTLEVVIDKTIFPAGAVLTNVCSYPSAGNGGNNAPFDCVVNPGSGFLVIEKVADPNDSTSFSFTVRPPAAGTNFQITGSNQTDPIGVLVTDAGSVTETVPAGWHLDFVTCREEGGGQTGTASGSGITGVTIESGLATTCTFTDSKARLQLAKAASPSTYTSPGQVITSTYTITNPNSFALPGPFEVVDDKQGTISPCGSGPLAAHATTTCTSTHTITQADIEAGSITNAATALTTFNGALVTSNQATATVTAVQAPTLSITKAATELSFDAVGQTIHYTIVATNVGNTTLQAVTVSDPGVTGLTCTPANGSALAPGASMSCTATHTVTQADLDAGHYANTACVDDGAGGAAQQCASKDLPAVQGPTLSITKAATETSFNAVGQVLHYTIVATNVGNTTLAAVTVTDPGVTGLTCTPANGSALAPGASLTCTATHTVTQADVDAGHYANTACVDDGAGGAAQQCASKDVPAVQTPALSITKVAAETSFDAVGQTIHYAIVATNVGNTTLQAVTVADPRVAGLSCTPANGSVLAPGASMSCTATHTVTQADIDAGHYANTACANAAGATEVCASEDVPAVQTPALSITKVATETSFDAVGQTIHYAIVATNVGNTTLLAATVSDPGVAGLSCTPANGSGLAPGASMSCTATHTVTQADIDAGHYANTACANAARVGATKPPLGRAGVTEVCASKDVPAVQTPSLSVLKTVNSTGPYGLGAVITYSVTVTNTGNQTLTGVTVTDPGSGAVLGACQPAIPAALAPGASIVCSASHAVTQADIDAGHYTNVATADSDQTPPRTDDETVPIGQNPALNVVKSVTSTGPYQSVGVVITYSVTVTNTGNQTLTGVTVTDPGSGAVLGACQPAIPATLVPGTSLVCTATHSVTQADLDAGRYTNVATADSAQTAPDTDDETVVTAPPVTHPSITIEKSPSSQTVAFGGTATFRITVTNNGDVALTNVSVSDPSSPNCNRDLSTLAAGASMSYTCTRSNVREGFVNTAEAVGTAPSSAMVRASATAPVKVSAPFLPPPHPAIRIVKGPNAQRVGFEGIARFRITVTNIGDVRLRNVSVADPSTPGCNRRLGTLAARASKTYSCMRPHVMKSFLNRAGVVGTAPNGRRVTDSDSAAVTTKKPVFTG